MNLTKSLDDVQEVPNNQPPLGGYVMCVENCFEQKTKKDLKDMFVFELDIYSGPYAGAFSSTPKKYYQVVDEKNLGRLKCLVNAFNMSNPGGKKITGSIIESADFTGLLIGAVLFHDEYTPGILSLKIDRLISIQDLKAHKFTIPPKRESWRLKQNQQNKNVMYQQPPNDEAPPIGDDDLPF